MSKTHDGAILFKKSIFFAFPFELVRLKTGNSGACRAPFLLAPFPNLTMVRRCL